MALDPDLPRYPTIVHALQASIARHPERRALVCRGRALTYAELGRALTGLARQLSSRGVQRQRVVVLLPTSIEAVVSVLGVLASGAEVAPINPFFTIPELRTVLAEIEPVLIISGDEAWPKLQQLIDDRTPILRWRSDELTLDALTRASDDWTDLPEPVPTDVAVALLTGGTTGVPKAVEHSHAALFVSLLQHCTVWPLRAGEERFLSAAPIFHIWGLFYATFVPLYLAGTLVLVPKYDPEQVLEAIEAERITVFGGGPAPVYLGLLASPRFVRTDFSSLTHCLSGGAPCPLELHQRWQRATGCALLEGWGMTEVAPLCLSRPGAPKPLSVGRPVPETTIEVVDLEHGTRVLGEGQTGELRVRGPQQMLGYRGRAEATRAAVREGWLYTGDVGYLDADGDLFLVDRKKDMIIVGGYNVYPRQVDEVLFRHADIAEAATVGRADALLGEVLVAFVVLRPGAELDEAGFFDYCRAELVKYKRPVAVTFLEALPRTAARKLDRKALRDMARQTVSAR
ncbi:MAG: AMP-binding protein [Polyangiaceae bacterium]